MAHIFSGNAWKVRPHQIFSLHWGLLTAGQTKGWRVTRTEYRGAWSMQPETSPWGSPQTHPTSSPPKAAGTDCTSQAENNPIYIYIHARIEHREQPSMIINTVTQQVNWWLPVSRKTPDHIQYIWSSVSVWAQSNPINLPSPPETLFDQHSCFCLLFSLLRGRHANCTVSLQG